MDLPICNNSSFNNLNYKSWVDKGVYLIGDVLSENTEVLNLNELIEIYGIQTNFLEYGAIKTSITFLNIITNLDVKGVSKLYKIRNSSKTNIITDIATKWKNKTGEEFTNDEIEQAFIINHKSNINMYMEYIQYRFLHYRVATKYELLKMDLVEFDKCAFCNNTETIEHLLYNCEKSKAIWNKVESWIRSMGSLTTIFVIKR